jgi:rSAM/selenodomain-associated transferase 2
MTVSVIIPVIGEASVINDTIGRIDRMAEGAAVEIIVVDGSAGEETLKATKGTRARGISSPKGRGRQMNAGAAAAMGDILLFLHADTELPEDAFQEISRAMAAGSCVAGAFDLAIADGARVFRIIERTASLRSRLTRIPYGDQAIFMRKDYFLELGGYREWPIMEDVDLMRRIKKKGGKVSFIDTPVTTSARRWRKEGILACTARNWAIMACYLVGVSPERLARWYR